MAKTGYRRAPCDKRCLGGWKTDALELRYFRSRLIGYASSDSTGGYSVTQIESFHVWQTSKVSAITFASMGFFFASVFVVLGLLNHAFALTAAKSAHAMTPRDALLLVGLMTVGVGVEALIFTAFFCWTYNRVAKIVGGIEFVMSNR